MDYDTNNDVVALQALCDKNGGFRTVAVALGVNDQSLYQILTRVKLPSGRPKGIGPRLREKLNRRYPGWNTLDKQKPDQITQLPDRLKATLLTVAGMFSAIPEDKWGDALLDIAELLQRGRRY